MSREFGLDWHKEDAIRMTKFITIAKYEAEERKKDGKKQDGGGKSKWRPRINR